MGVIDWFRKLFGRGGRPPEMVPFYDVEARRVVRIPAAEQIVRRLYGEQRPG